MTTNRLDMLRQSFYCPKCKGRSAHVDQATLPLTGGRFFPLKPGRFIVATCTLCGYTEFYDQSVWAEEREAQEREARGQATNVLTPLVKPQNGGA